MKKIVIISKNKQIDRGLVDLLKDFFPECDIRVHFEEREEVAVSSEDTYLVMRN